MKKKGNDLNGKMLVATPTTNPSSYFFKSVIYIVKHDSKGAIGLMVNQLLSPVQHDLFIKPNADHKSQGMRLMNIDAYIGGPVDSEKGFLLHNGKLNSGENSIKISSSIGMLRNVLNGKGPKQSLFALGYCGWDSRQLDTEIKNNAWIVLDANSKVIFETASTNKWEEAFNSLDINPALYINKIGHC